MRNARGEEGLSLIHIFSALANVQASLFLQTLIDNYIIPMTQQQDPSFAPLAGALVRVGCIYVVGILAAWLNARIMVNVTPVSYTHLPYSVGIFSFGHWQAVCRPVTL